MTMARVGRTGSGDTKKRSLQEHDSMHPDWSKMVKLCIDAVRNPTYKSASTTGARFEGPYKWIFLCMRVLPASDNRRCFFGDVIVVS